MKRIVDRTAKLMFLLGLAVLTACGGPASPSTIVPSSTSSASPPTTVPASATATTAVAAPSPASALSPTELKYLLLDHFGQLFFCDPDQFPVARQPDAAQIDAHVAEIEKDPEEFQTILKHLGLAGTTTLSPDQKLLVYNEAKKLNAIQLSPSGDQYTFQLRIAQGQGRALAIEGLISPDGLITVSTTQPTIATCPICLARNTRIDTPTGSIPVQDLRVGSPVWTVDAAGARRPGVVLQTAQRPVPSGFAIVHLVLDDGRELFVSPGHPTVDGRTIGDLAPDDLLDGAHIVSADRIYYSGNTYDILPGGATGEYWANGILLKSTLRDK